MQLLKLKFLKQLQVLRLICNIGIEGHSWLAQATDQRAGTHRFLLRDGAYYSYELSPYQTHSPGDHDRSQVTL